MKTNHILAAVFVVCVTFLIVMMATAPGVHAATPRLDRIVAASSVAAHHDCGAVNPITNRVAWTHAGQVYGVQYHDRGEIVFPSSVPQYVRDLVTKNSGTAIRMRCAS